MGLLRILAVGAFLLATPALADEWKVESVSGDAVSTKADSDPEPLDVGSVVPEGATVVSGSQTSVKLRRGNDVVSFTSNAIVEIRGGGDARATVAPIVGDFQFDAVANDKGPFEVTTKWFNADAIETASFRVKARKDGALLDVDRGVVELHDPQRGGEAIEIKAGGSFRGVPLTKAEADAKAKAAGSDPNDPNLDKMLDKAPKGGKTSKKQSELVKKLAGKGAQAIKEGLDDMADYDGDPLPAEAPKVGILDFLFGKDAPNTGTVLGAIGAVFLIGGAVTAKLLQGVSFGMFGNGAILLIGAFAGAAVHDFLCPPDLMWNYEPTPGIVITTLGAFAMLLGGCFARRYVEDRMEKAADAAAKAARAARAGAGIRRFG